jgi:hypothetical protein
VKQERNCSNYFLVGKKGKGHENVISKKFKELHLFGLLSGQKFIPESYRRSNIKDRLNLLAGERDNTFSNES